MSRSFMEPFELISVKTEETENIHPEQSSTTVNHVKICVKNLYCYICNKTFDSQSQFQSHHHLSQNGPRIDSKVPKGCLDKDDGINVTCHKCLRHFSSLNLFLDHLQRAKKKYVKNPRRRKRRKRDSQSRTELKSSFKKIKREDDSISDTPDFSGFSPHNNNTDLNGCNYTPEKIPPFENIDNANDPHGDDDPEFNPLDDQNEDEDWKSSDSEFSLKKSQVKPKPSSKKTIKKRQESININEKRVRPQNPTVCSICDKTFSHRHVLYKHIRRLHPNFVPPLLRNRSKSTVVPSTPKFRACKATSNIGEEPKLDEMDDPKDEVINPGTTQSSPPPTRRVCHLCGKAYQYHTVLLKHLRKVHGPDSIEELSKRPALEETEEAAEAARVSCSVCDKSYSCKSVVYKHMRAVHGLESLASIPWKRNANYFDEQGQPVVLSVRCGIEDCGKMLPSESALKYHMAVKHRDNEEEEGFKCPYPPCDQRFALKGNLRQHISSKHDTRKSFLCDQCPRRFKTHAHLEEHQRIHRGERPFLCSFCPMTFTFSSGIRRHLLTHNAVRKFVCDWEGCGKRFNMSQTLKRHRQQHTGFRPYKCKFCTVAFHDNKPLKKHVAEVHPDKSLQDEPTLSNDGQSGQLESLPHESRLSAIDNNIDSQNHCSINFG